MKGDISSPFKVEQILIQALHDFLHLITATAFARLLADSAAVAAGPTGTGIFCFRSEVQVFTSDCYNGLVAFNLAHNPFAEGLAAITFSLFTRHGLAVATVSAGTDIDGIPLFIDREGLVGKRDNGNQQHAYDEQSGQGFFHVLSPFSVFGK